LRGDIVQNLVQRCNGVGIVKFNVPLDTL